MLPTLRPLSFSAVDDLGFAGQLGRLDGRAAKAVFSSSSIGPLLELVHLSEEGVVRSPGDNPWVSLGGLTALYQALVEGREQWLSRSCLAGYFRTSEVGSPDETTWTSFCFEAQRTAEAAGLSRQVARKAIAALREMVDNVYVHSEASESGLVAFQARNGQFEFFVGDHGVGVLSSLRRCESYASLSSHSDALRVALTEGASRFGPGEGRGMGFRPIIVGLANLSHRLRFRSGDQALTIERNDGSMTARSGAKPRLGGFLICCELQA